MLDKYLIQHCSPTLASLKSANLFTYAYDCEKDLKNQILVWNNSLNARGVKLFLLKNKNNVALIYVYREKMLLADLNNADIQKFLSKYGYTDFSITKVLPRLKYRILCEDTFPHEIGIFLGYPLGDVIGFIDNEGRNCKYVGCWKVYCNECDVIKMFTKFKKCTNLYMHLWNEGKSVVQLTVAV